jgi:hypothetical protein
MTVAERVPVLEPATHGAEQARSVDNTSGDPVCLLDKVCSSCGLLSGSDDLTCQRCGHTGHQARLTRRIDAGPQRVASAAAPHNNFTATGGSRNGRQLSGPGATHLRRTPGQ